MAANLEEPGFLANIEFNETHFIKPNETEEETEQNTQRFVDFTRNFIQNHDQDDRVVVDSVFVKILNPKRYHFLINECIIRFATVRNVKRLVIDFSDTDFDENDMCTNHNPRYVLPSLVYENRAIESLTLFSCQFDVSRLRDFTTLKEISLGWIDLNRDKIKALLENCPFLEVFSLKCCWNFNVIQISSSNARLRSLIIDKCHDCDAYFEIEAPNLRFFKYSGTIPMVHFNKAINLVEADLDFGFEFEFEFEEIADRLHLMLVEIPPVRVLKVCSYVLQVIQNTESIKLGIRSDVQHLILKTRLHSNEFYGIKCMFETFDSFEMLTIRLGPSQIFPDYEPPSYLDPKNFWKESQVNYDCLGKTLKIVEVENFKGEENEVNFLNYLIKSGKVLECMKLEVFNDKHEPLTSLYKQRAEELKSIRRASPMLRIEVID